MSLFIQDCFHLLVIILLFAFSLVFSIFIFCFTYLTLPVESPISLSTLPVFASFHLKWIDVESDFIHRGTICSGREVILQGLGGNIRWVSKLSLVGKGFQDFLPCEPSLCASSAHFQFWRDRCIGHTWKSSLLELKQGVIFFWAFGKSPKKGISAAAL